MSFRNLIKQIFFLSPIFLFLASPFTGLSQDFDKHTVIVKLKPEFSTFFKKKNSLAKYNIQCTQVNTIIKKKSSKNKEINNIYKLTLSNNNSIIETCKKLNSLSIFEYCQPNYYDKILYTPSDSRIANQYALSITKTFDAWEIYKGDSSVIVGISDTGIDFDHEDLHDNIAYNTNDPIDGEDNDNDGYIDNYMGWDFGCGDNNPQWNESGSSRNMIHGIFVSGLAGAKTDNDKGIASIGYSTQILPIKISDDNGSITTGYESIIYAAEHGCKIINCSWGSTVPHNFGKDVIKYVTEDLGVIIVAAAGNNNNESLFYPASYDNVVSVAASNNQDEKWSNSSYNWRVDITAPGQDVLSTVSGSGYSTSSGTSFSSPIVASALSLLLSYYPDTLSNTQLIEILKVSSDCIDTVNENPNYKYQLGYGRLNVYKALQGNYGASLNYKKFNILNESQPASAGDTAEFSGFIINYLKSSQDINVKISSSSEYIKIIDSTFIITQIDENEQINIDNLHLELLIDPSTPNNTNVKFVINYDGENYHKHEIREINISFKSIEINKNRIHTTLFPEGRISHNYKQKGFGFSLDNQDDILYEMGIIAGISDENTISNVQSYTDIISNNLDSSKTGYIWHAENITYNDNRLPLNIKTKYEIFDLPIYQNLFFIHYTITNTSSINYNNFYFGILANWDIYKYDKNYTSIDSNLRLALTHYTHETIAGIQLLSHNNWHRYAINNINQNTFINSTDGLSRDELYYALSNNNFYEGIDKETDIIDILSAGPFNIDFNDSITVTFAILADTNKQNIITSGEKAQKLYDSLYQTVNIKKQDLTNQTLIYPNPSQNFLFVYISPKEEPKAIKIFDIKGIPVLEIQTKLRDNKIDISNLEKGIYLVKCGSISKKILIN